MIIDSSKYRPDTVYELMLDKKFWHAAVCKDLSPTNPNKPWVVISRWGYDGMAGHVNYIHFATQAQAGRYVSERKRDKLLKGYTLAGTVQSVPLIPLDMRPIRTESSPARFVETEWDLFE